MSDKIKIALLCNNKMAIPALQRIATAGMLCGVAIADNDAEVAHVMKSMTSSLGVPCTSIAKAGYKMQLAEWLLTLKPDVVFVMTFPWRIPAEVLAMPRMGFLNFHYGLLPQMRGADPIFESIRHRMAHAGTTVHLMDEGLDTGPILLREELPLSPDLTYGMLAGQVAWLGDKMCGDIIDHINATGTLPPATLQKESDAKYWPKIGEADMTIDWSEMDSASIMAMVRACNPVAKGVPTTINGWKIGVCDVSEINLEGVTTIIAPGTIVALDQQNGMIVYCKDGKGLKLEVVYTGEGVFPGYKLAFFGIQPGMVFGV